MIFFQLFESNSSTYTYLLGCEDCNQAILIDPVINAIDRDLNLLKELGLRLAFTIDTHIHADHVTSALELKKRVGSKIAMPKIAELTCTDCPLEEGVPLRLGSLELQPLHTPGHTDEHYTLVCEDKVFTGDCLLIDGCGRTDFQNGDTDALYKSVTQKLFRLPENFLVYPAHDYNDRRVSNIAQEKIRNKRLGGNKTLSEFRTIMDNLNLDYPKFIDYAVPANKRCGVCPEDLPETLQQYCESMSASLQG